ncbi:MAG TPA: hypothetical protein VGQ36_17210 [Thermoanaerobaculia bacterium]|jgi:hypothetical protein|nr:hypothetical protein [Thermoanaerobaculia bacterium]
MTATPLLLVGLMLYGVPLALSFDSRLRGPTLAGTSFLLGAGAAGLHLFALSVMRVPWTRTSVVLSMVPLFAIAVFVAKRRARLQPASPGEGGLKPRPTFVDAITIAIVIAYALFAIWAPPYEWDFYGIWGLKARWFFETRGMDWSTVPHIGKADYPVLMPLLFDFVAVVTKEWNDRAFGWIYVGLCASVLAIMRGMFADEVKRPALATLVIAFPTLNLWIGLAEAGVMAFGCAGLLFLRRGSIALGAVMLGLAAWSKNEGLALIGVAAIALLVATRSIRKVLQLWPAIALIAPWMITRSVLKLSTDFTEGSMLKRVFERLGNPAEVVNAFVKAPPDQPWFWLAALLAVLVFIRDAVRREAFLLIVVALQLGLMFAQALATTWDFAAHVSLTLNRLPHQIAPAAGFLAALLLMRELTPKPDP